MGLGGAKQDAHAMVIRPGAKPIPLSMLDVVVFHLCVLPFCLFLICFHVLHFSCVRLTCLVTVFFRRHIRDHLVDFAGHVVADPPHLSHGFNVGSTCTLMRFAPRHFDFVTVLQFLEEVILLIILTLHDYSPSCFALLKSS